MSTKWFATASGPDAPVPEEYVDVGLAHFAALLGMTRRQYAQTMMEFIRQGRLLDLLKFEAQAQFETWIMDSDNRDDEKQFCVVFRLSLNRVHDDALFCVCSVDLDKVLLNAHSIKVGFIDMPPDEIETEDMDVFNIMFCDLETNLFGAKDV